ncbi:Uncharacterised protein [Mycobacterium tuberculosis]|nr:Uncharacterised protein [Mycobacterium tuberculosis]CNV25141.1 Uncharacterised protein [Mycobacterium tuberculosis]
MCWRWRPPKPPARPEPKAAGRSAWCCPDRPARTRRYIKRCNWPTDRYSRRSRTHRPAGSAHRTSRMPLDMSARPGRFQAAGSRQRPAGASCLPRTHRPGTAPHRATRRACRTISCGLHAARRPAGKSPGTPRRRPPGWVQPGQVDTSRSSPRRTSEAAAVGRSAAPETRSDACPPGGPPNRKLRRQTRAWWHCSDVLQSRSCPTLVSSEPLTPR